MNEKELIGKIHSSMYHQFQVRGYAAPVDVLIDTGICLLYTSSVCWRACAAKVMPSRIIRWMKRMRKPRKMK